MRILVVDDEENLTDQIRLALTRQNYTVDTAADGEKALDKIYIEPYDLILLDIMLPRKDGYGVLFELRNEKNATPVLMLTARGAVEDRIKGLDMGADDYLAKPFSMEELLARIRALLRRSNELVSPLLTTGSKMVPSLLRQTQPCYNHWAGCTGSKYLTSSKTSSTPPA